MSTNNVSVAVIGAMLAGLVYWRGYWRGYCKYNNNSPSSPQLHNPQLHNPPLHNPPSNPHESSNYVSASMFLSVIYKNNNVTQPIKANIKFITHSPIYIHKLTIIGIPDNFNCRIYSNFFVELKIPILYTPTTPLIIACAVPLPKQRKTNEWVNELKNILRSVKFEMVYSQTLDDTKTTTFFTCE